MNKVLSSIVAVAVAGATFGAFAQPAKKSETTVEQSTTVTAPTGDVKDKKKTTTSTTTTTNPEPTAAAKSSTSTKTTERKSDGSKVKTETKVETEKKY